MTQQDLLTPELRARARTLRFHSSLAGVSGFGTRISPRRGMGLQFTELREYSPGDDIKRIAWKATARTGRPLIKVYEEERQVRVMVLVDVSSSLDVGPAPTNGQRARSLGAAILWAATSRHEVVGCATFSTILDNIVAPSTSRNTFSKALQILESSSPARHGTNIANVITEFLQTGIKPSLLFFISDFASGPFTKELQLLAAKHEVICIALPTSNNFDQVIPAIVEIEDSETGMSTEIDARTLSKERLGVSNLSEICRNAGAQLVPTQHDSLGALITYLKRRRKNA